MGNDPVEMRFAVIFRNCLPVADTGEIQQKRRQMQRFHHLAATTAERVKRTVTVRKSHCDFTASLQGKFPDGVFAGYSIAFNEIEPVPRIFLPGLRQRTIPHDKSHMRAYRAQGFKIWGKPGAVNHNTALTVEMHQILPPYIRIRVRF